MALNPSALAADDSGHAATVQASGGNKMKLQKGVAVFKEVKITAESGGDYLLRVASGSRKVPLNNSLCQTCICNSTSALPECCHNILIKPVMLAI